MKWVAFKVSKQLANKNHSPTKKEQTIPTTGTQQQKDEQKRKDRDKTAEQKRECEWDKQGKEVSGESGSDHTESGRQWRRTSEGSEMVVVVKWVRACR
jgi:hypothetical protein